MTLERLDTAHACISKRSMVDMGDMALYASPDGLVRIAGGRADLMTRNIISPEDWRQRFQPDTIHTCFHDGRYFGFYGNSVNGGGFIFSPDDGTFTELGTYADACFRDLQDDSLYLAIGNIIQAWDKGTELMPFRWCSKVFQGKPAAFTSARVMADSYTELCSGYSATDNRYLNCRSRPIEASDSPQAVVAAGSLSWQAPIR